MAEYVPPPSSRPVRPPAGGPVGVPPPDGDGPLVTEGMQARRRNIERKRRDWRREQDALEEDAREGWVRVWKIVGVIVLVAGLAYVYWRIQTVYQNQWPLGLVWGALALFLLAGIIWMLWYINKSDM